jgi:general secretion pathway protein D
MKAIVVVLALLGQEQDKVKVEFEDVELEALAQQVERVTKKTFVFQQAVFQGRKVTLRSEKPITPDEFYRVFQSVCLMHGFALVPSPEENIQLVKIVPAPQASKEPGAQPVLARGQALPPGEGLVFYVLTPRHITGQRAAAVVQPALSPTGSLVPVPNSDLALVIDAASAVQRAEKLLALVDVAGDPIVAVPVVLRNIAAAQAKTQVVEFVQAVDRVTTGEQGRTRLEVLSDDRLNQVHLVGREPDVQRAREYLGQVDLQLASVQRTIGYYRLRNVPVQDVVDSVRQFLGLAVTVREGDRRRAGAKPAGPLHGAPVRELAGLPALPPTVTPPPPAGGAPRAEAEEGQEPPAPTAPQAPRPSKSGVGPSSTGSPADIEVAALEAQNTLVVIGNAAVHEEVKKILENLDKRKGQVLIEVAILQVTGDDSLETGVEVLFQEDRSNGAKVQGGTGFGQSTQADPGGTGFPTQQVLGSFTGGALRYLKTDEISALIRLVSTKSSVNILSQPILLVNDNEAANFTTKVSEPTVAVSQGTVGNVTSFAGFAEAVTSLSITPQISPEGYLNLKITQSFEEFTGESGGTGVPPPKVSNNVSTMIAVPDRHTAILGGFTRDAMTETKTGIPLLMDIPLLGWLAGRRETRLTKSRLYLFVRPRILSAEGFGDLRDLSREKAGAASELLRDPRIKMEVDGTLRPRVPGVKEAPLPLENPK